MGQSKAAVIDMGTNTFHLLMVRLHDAGFETLYKEKIPVKIGQGGISQNTITPDAQKRAFHTLEHFKNLITGEKINDVFVFATSAVRNAKNGDEFVKEVFQKFGLRVLVIDGTTEAQLIYQGIRLSGCLAKEASLMMDIGGGSVEFIIGTQSGICWKQSFEIGGQRMLDLFHYHDPIMTEEIEKLFAYLDDKLQPLIQAIDNYKPNILVGASGTFDTLTDMYLASQSIPKSKSQNVYKLPRKAFEDISSSLIHLTKEERLKIPGMIAMRVDMIVVASCLIRFILKYVDAKELVCSTYSLKEGVIAEIMSNKTIIDTTKAETFS